MNMVRILVKYISTVTFYITGVTGYVYSQMMLCYDFDRKMILKNFNFRMIFQSSDQTILNFSSGIVLMMQNAEFGMSSFFMKIKFSILVFIKTYSPIDQLLNLTGSFSHHFLDRSPIADPISRNHRIFNVLLKIIDQRIGYRSNSSLCVKRIRFFKTCFTNYSYTTFFSYFQGKTHPCYTRAYYQKIKFMCHIFLFFDTIAERIRTFLNTKVKIK